LEEQINGVEDMMYMKSVAGSDGTLQMTITFRPGTDRARRRSMCKTVYPRPCRACLRRWSASRDDPEAESGFLVLVTLISDGRYDALYLRNYANIRVKDQIARLPGVGEIRQFGSGDYAMRVWLDPDKSPRAVSPPATSCARSGSRTCKSRPASSAPSRSREAPTS